MSGTLFVVATPIGNLEDITLRALRTLREVDLVAAEDTRRTAKLLAHFEIHTAVVSVREHNEAQEASRVIRQLSAGKSIALVSDAGTPGIADPGARLVAAVRDAGLPIVPIPGPSAVAAALSVSGFNADEFVFMGFVPRSGSAREDWFDRLKAESRPVVAFEVPHRIRRTLDDAKFKLVKRHIFVARELSKVYEELVLKPISDVESETVVDSGEFILIFGPHSIDDLVEHRLSLAADVVGFMTNVCDMPMLDSIVTSARGFRVEQLKLRKALKHRRYAAKTDAFKQP